MIVGITLKQSLVSRSLPVLLPTLRQPGFMQRPLLHHADCGVAQLQTIFEDNAQACDCETYSMRMALILHLYI